MYQSWRTKHARSSFIHVCVITLQLHFAPRLRFRLVRGRLGRRRFFDLWPLRTDIYTMIIVLRCRGESASMLLRRQLRTGGCAELDSTRGQSYMTTRTSSGDFHAERLCDYRLYMYIPGIVFDTNSTRFLACRGHPHLSLPYASLIQC